MARVFMCIKDAIFCTHCVRQSSFCRVSDFNKGETATSRGRGRRRGRGRGRGKVDAPNPALVAADFCAEFVEEFHGEGSPNPIPVCGMLIVPDISKSDGIKDKSGFLVGKLHRG
ncbi:hypothetical protein CJ030_MR3G008404 [Morella rubra]|uniref:Uncharacterized protein n=1 Tax=Morella rubra TaxID=262757 RepID=A0A6A1W1L5_9ROSI|nr:hypothetical protein CJ030_MR3G008404 [Morella rubra]